MAIKMPIGRKIIGIPGTRIMKETTIDPIAGIDPKVWITHEILTKETILVRYDKVRISYKNRGRNKDKYQNKNKNRYRDDNYDQIRGTSRERHCTYNVRKVTTSLKLELLNNIVQQLDPNKEMKLKFLKAISEDVDDLLDNTSSVADVEYWIEERLVNAKNPKAKNKNLTKDPHVNTNDISLQNYPNPIDYESVYEGTNLTQESVDTKYIEESNSDRNSGGEVQILDLDECEIIHKLDLWELEQIPHAVVRLAEGQVLEEFMFEE